MNDINILNHFKVRSFKEDINQEINDFEIKSDLLLPPIFKLFLQTYNWNQSTSAFPLNFLNPKFNNIIPLSTNIKYEFTKTKLPTLEYFMSLDESYQALQNYKELKDFNIQTIPIIKLSNEVIITLGYIDKTLDKIFLIDLDKPKEKQFKLVAENIFKLLRGFIIGDSNYSLELKNQLSLNWNDKYWSIK